MLVIHFLKHNDKLLLTIQKALTSPTSTFSFTNPTKVQWCITSLQTA